MTNEKFDKLAQALGYETIVWNYKEQCFVGLGSSDPFDRSKDNGDCFVAWGIAELEDLYKQEFFLT